MTGEERRNELLNTISKSVAPISGAALAKKYQVSRQVIVQDMALLRAAHHEIYATPKGYVIQTSHRISSKQSKQVLKEYRVAHTDEQIEDELNTIVDMGGRVLDVSIRHEVYGTIRGDLPIRCRKHVQDFIEEIRSGKSKPLKNLTSGGIHYHKVEADSEETLELIEQELKRKGYLV
ncbi:MAG: transcription repressor NadR [Lachnospiraceae bacterium]|nr:transcription repressor NadR [Lachnospiraceae bacterium]